MSDKDKLAKYRTEIQQVSSSHFTVHAIYLFRYFALLETA